MIDFDPGTNDRPKVGQIGAMNLVLIAAVIAILSIVCLVPKVYVGCAVFGAIGLILCGYSMGYVHRHVEANQRTLLVIAGAALLISVVGFMFGFLGMANSL